MGGGKESQGIVGIYSPVFHPGILISAVTAVATVAVSPAETAAVPSAVGVVTSFIAPVVSPVVPAPVARETGSRRDYRRWR